MTAPLLVAALLLDAAVGEPVWLWSRLPHPAVVMGRAVDMADQRLNRGTHRKMKGLVAMAGLGLLAVLLGWLIHLLPDFGIVEWIVAAILLAHKSLVQHVSAVADALRLSLGDARRAVGKIVGRDTGAMTSADVARAAIESAAENFSDGVIAPAFWYLIGGLPGLMLYKITNTADSMIGHRTPRHDRFGWAAARFDDLLNLIPARLTALIIAVVYGRWKAAPVIGRDAGLHRSPNAGWPEAAMAVILGVSLCGPRSYAGVMQDFPYVYPEGRRDLGAGDIDASVAVLWRSWAGFVGAAMVLALAMLIL